MRIRNTRKKSKSEKKLFASDERIVMGRNCLNELFQHFPERIVRVFTTKSKENSDSLVKKILDRKIPIRFIDKQELFMMVESESHQSFVAIVKKRPQTEPSEFLLRFQNKESSLVLALDSISDPQNLGALLRLGECFGADAVIWSKNRGVGLTPSVTKASVGASELVETMKVSNLAETIKKFKNAGYWIIAAELDKNAECLYSFTFPEKTLIVLGSEGKGIQKLISKNSDYKIFIPMQGKISSLNVSQAAAVFLSHRQAQFAKLSFC